MRFDRIISEQPAIMASANEQPGKFTMRCTLAELDALHAASDGTCAICGRIPRGKLAHDHDHGNGRLRGLLCTGCNTALGKFQDSVEVLQRAIDYLRRHGK